MGTLLIAIIGIIIILTIYRKQGETIMATLQDVKDAIAAEKAEITSKLADLDKQIQDLKDQIANGSPVTAADLDEIVSNVHDIFVA